MTETERLAAIEAIRNLKAVYWRGVDLCDGEMVRAILAEHCELDYRGCCTDPVSGFDFLPVMNVVLKGRHRWTSQALDGFVTVHQGHQAEITVTGPDSAAGIWAFSDRFFYPPGMQYRTLTGYGHYHDTYRREGDGWKLQTTRITRLRVEAA
ncbi:MAG: nuclear transport factor 2 family protein [Sphingomonadales bacterium]|nr:nuclear transport factor 2 family protein [Sphingomonadales bacterium]